MTCMQELNAMIRLGWGDWPQNQMPPYWRKRRAPRPTPESQRKPWTTERRKRLSRSRLAKRAMTPVAAIIRARWEARKAKALARRVA